MNNSLLLFSLLLAFFITLVAIRLLKSLAPQFGLMDVKDHRKHHIGEIPLIGGIAMYIGIIFSALLLLPTAWGSLTWLFASAGIVLLGVWDDAKDIPVRLRLIIQAVMTFILSTGSGYYLVGLGNLFGFGDIYLSYFGYVVTVLAVIGAINAFNMMDGIDGLAGMMALVSFGALAILFGLSGDSYGLNVSLLLLVVILPYLANNLLLPPFKHKIFMGDAGAMLIGFSVVWLLIYGSQSSTEGFSFRPVTALWVMAIPLMDMVAIMIRRVRKGSSPFKADRDHLHHIFMHAGFSSLEALHIITGLSLLFATCGVLGEVWGVPEPLMLGSFLVLFLGYNYAIKHAWKFSKAIHKKV